MPSVDGQPRYPVVEFRENIKGTVDVRFIILKDGSTRNHEALSFSTAVFERAATTYIESSRFPKRKAPCVHQLTVALEMKDRIWAVESYPTGNGEN